MVILKYWLKVMVLLTLGGLLSLSPLAGQDGSGKENKGKTPTEEKQKKKDRKGDKKKVKNNRADKASTGEKKSYKQKKMERRQNYPVAYLYRGRFLNSGWAFMGIGAVITGISLHRTSLISEEYDSLGQNATQSDFDRAYSEWQGRSQGTRKIFWGGMSVSLLGATLVTLGYAFPAIYKKALQKREARKSAGLFIPTPRVDGFVLSYYRAF